MVKRINCSPYEKLVLLACVKEYAMFRWLEIKGRKKKMPGRQSQISTLQMLMSPRGPVNSWKLAGKKLEKTIQTKKKTQ